jgi:flavoprotein
MPFRIDQNLCVGCGSCIGSCPNRAIISRGNQVLITDMCCDCGICKHYCGIAAISMGASKAELNNKKLDRALKEKRVLTKDIAAMKFADTVPAGAVSEDGLNFWCHICGDIFEGQVAQSILEQRTAPVAGLLH